MQVLLWRYFAIFTVLIIAVVSLVCFGVLGNAYSAQARDRITTIGRGLTMIIDGKNSQFTGEVGGEMNRYAFTEGVDVFSSVDALIANEPDPRKVEIFSELKDVLVSKAAGGRL